MAWHILHGLLEQVRTHSTFPAKVWIFMMFVFRIVIVARIGDMVYHDEQENFICNTLTPGCPNVCFNGFSPISQLRYWSLSVLVVTVPSIFFYIYATHKIYHAHVKFPDEEEEEDFDRRDSYSFSPSVKRKRENRPPPSYATGSPLYKVKRLNARNLRKSNTNDAIRRRKHQRNYGDDEKENADKQGSTTDNNHTPTEDLSTRKFQHWAEPNGYGYPIYVDSRGTKVEYIKKPKVHTQKISENKQRKLFLENPALYRAYWWHVVMRTILEAGFLVGQYYLYGWKVPEVYQCTREPCFDVVYCYVSRPMEKSCLMWIMYGLGFFACLLSVAEFWTLGFTRIKTAFCCCQREDSDVPYEEKRRRLARLETYKDKKDEAKLSGEAAIMYRKGFHVSLDSLSSATTVESV